MTMNNSITKLITSAAFSVTAAFAAEITVSENITTDTTWSADNTYVLDGQIFVTEGAELTIEAGTTIYGEETEPASALIITVGSTIDAQGTADAPIVFTSILAQEGDLTADDAALWGGLIILGDASINSRADSETTFTDPITDQIEGFEGAGIEELITFGGSDDDDNSGTLRYVSIRHGGSVVGADNEINGLTLGGVGSETTIEFIEVFANKDDAIEFFGGTVDVKYFVNAFGYDDGVDYDQGWRGKMQFVFHIQREATEDAGDKAGEHDGATSPKFEATPLGEGVLANVTAIGWGENTALNIRDNAGSEYYNSIFTNFDKLFLIESDISEDLSLDRLNFVNGIWWSSVSDNNTVAGIQDLTGDNVDITSVITAGNNEVTNPLLNSISIAGDGTLDPRPSADSPAIYGAAAVPDGDFFVQTGYRGAFDPNAELWIAGWTALDEYGFLADTSGAETSSITAVSSRLTVNPGAEVNVGFILTATTDMYLAAKSISDEGVDTLEDPTMTLFRFNGTEFVSVAVVDDFDSSTTFPSAVAPVLSTDTAAILTLDAGSYAVVVSGETDTDSGEVLVEAYDLGYANSVSE